VDIVVTNVSVLEGPGHELLTGVHHSISSSLDRHVVVSWKTLLGNQKVFGQLMCGRGREPDVNGQTIWLRAELSESESKPPS
jgi:hypothetical protein